MTDRVGVPYFRAVEGEDGLYHWAQCPECGAVVLNRDGYGPARHWATHESLGEVWCLDCDQPATGPDSLCDLHRGILKEI